MDELKQALKQYDLSNKEIDQAIDYYNYAVTNEIPYPVYYAISKLHV